MILSSDFYYSHYLLVHPLYQKASLVSTHSLTHTHFLKPSIGENGCVQSAYVQSNNVICEGGH